jgi:predicted RNA-binding protein
MEPSSVVMKNVMQIECRDGLVILTDLMERQLEIRGVLTKANLVEGFVVVQEN